jgi:ADP-dependent NAD(P)H-hydrate dehydratase
MRPRWNAVVALKGARTVIAAPGGERWQHEGGNVGLATSGSGDVLAGIIAGLAARGAELAQAATGAWRCMRAPANAWPNALGTLGYLARELPDEIPALMEQAGGGNADAAVRPSGNSAGGLRVER